MNSSALWAIIGVIILAALGFWFFSTQQAAAPSTNTTVDQGTGTPTDSGSQGGVGADVGVDVGIGDASNRVSYSTSGFSPQEITVKRGTTVTWTNNGGGNMWVGSAQHPTHVVYSGTTLSEHCDDAVDVSFDQCKNGNTYSFTFNKVGTWGYHNHSNAQHFGRVIVTQ